jgi:hypothetical protein
VNLVEWSPERERESPITAFGEPCRGKLIEFVGTPRQDADSLFTRKVVVSFEELSRSDAASFAQGVLTFSRRYGGLQLTGGDIFTVPYVEPLQLWADFVDFYRDVLSHVRVAGEYVASGGDNEYARRYFRDRIDPEFLSGWVLPAGRFRLHRPFVRHLDEFIRRVPAFMAETVGEYLRSYAGNPFELKVDVGRHKLHFEPMTLEGALLVDMVRQLFLPASGRLERICEHERCREPFHAARRDQRFCSVNCRVAHHRLKHQDESG